MTHLAVPEAEPTLVAPEVLPAWIGEPLYLAHQLRQALQMREM
ncbi:MAG TPA: hypothetical protein VF916_12515 [Ktedonobacterales bacterium]